MSEPVNDMTLRPQGDGATLRYSPEAGVVLLALRSYWLAWTEERARVCNGAGPRWLDAFLPWWLRWVRIFVDCLWALNCREAFNIHDWDYVHLPLTVEAKVAADDRLRENLEVIVSAGRAPQWLKTLRRRMARRYVFLVREYGFKAFFDREV